MNFLKQLFCWHKWILVGICYPLNTGTYECARCGNTKIKEMK